MRIRIDRWASYGHFEAGKTSLTLKNVSFLFKKTTPANIKLFNTTKQNVKQCWGCINTHTHTHYKVNFWLIWTCHVQMHFLLNIAHYKFHYFWIQDFFSYGANMWENNAQCFYKFEIDFMMRNQNLSTKKFASMLVTVYWDKSLAWRLIWRWSQWAYSTCLVWDLLFKK